MTRLCTKMELIREQEDGVATAIQAIYRDLDYAKTLIKVRGALQGATKGAGLDEDVDIEESWTFIGDESDPDLQRKMQEIDLSTKGRPPRVSMDGLGLRSVQGVEPVRKSSIWKT